MQNVLSAIKWSVCITIKPAGDIYSRTLVRAPSLCTKELATASTIPRRSSASVQALLRSSNQHFKLPKFLELEGWSTSSSERGDVRLCTRTDRQSGHSHSAVP